MKELAPAIAAAVEADSVFRAAGIPYCMIGGLAIYRWGEPRYTRDVDFSIICPIGAVDDVVSRISERLRPRVDGAAEFARRSHVYLAQSSTGYPLDIALGFSGYEQRCIDRATPGEFAAGIFLMTCSAEDLVVQKMFAARDRDFDDVLGILARQTGKLDWELIHRELGPLAELRDDIDLLDRLRGIRKNAGA